jgi:phosphoribosylformylglycinamidine synthase
MNSYEIMLSESQERMLLVAEKGREHEVTAVFTKWGLDCAEIGIVTADDTMRVLHHGELVAEIPNKALTDDAPVYNRPVGVWAPPVPRDPPAWVLEELKKPRDYTADLKKLLASANICDKRWVFEQYDSMVQTNTVQGPGGEAGVMRIKGTGHPAMHTSRSLDTMMPGVMNFAPLGGDESDVIERAKGERGLAMALAGNGRWCYLDPKLGAMHAVAEAARKVACTGAKPVAATNCLNFGNPEKPEIMAQLSAAIDGIAEACTALGTPITGGNVSLYNETKGEGIYPTPVIGVVGIIEDVTKSVPSAFQRAGDAVVLLTLPIGTAGTSPLHEFGSSEFAKTILGTTWGGPPFLQLLEESELHKALAALAQTGLIYSACDVSDGGLAVALAKACLPNRVGVWAYLHEPMWGVARELFGEDSSLVLVTCDHDKLNELKVAVDDFGFVFPQQIGSTVTTDQIDGDPDFQITFGAELPVISTTVSALHEVFASSLESNLAEEVPA